MKGTVKGEDILREVKETLLKVDISEDKICGIATDGAAALTGKNKDLCLFSTTLLVML